LPISTLIAASDQVRRPCDKRRQWRWLYGLDLSTGFDDIASRKKELRMAQGNQINWLNVTTVVSAAILIGAEVFGAAFAGSWAIATLFDLGSLGARVLDVVFVLCGLAVMVQFIRAAHRIEPFTTRG
jgi:hypothetical protein